MEDIVVVILAYTLNIAVLYGVQFIAAAIAVVIAAFMSGRRLRRPHVNAIGVVAAVLAGWVMQLRYGLSSDYSVDPSLTNLAMLLIGSAVAGAVATWLLLRYGHRRLLKDE